MLAQYITKCTLCLTRNGNTLLTVTTHLIALPGRQFKLKIGDCVLCHQIISWKPGERVIYNWLNRLRFGSNILCKHCIPKIYTTPNVLRITLYRHISTHLVDVLSDVWYRSHLTLISEIPMSFIFEFFQNVRQNTVIIPLKFGVKQLQEIEWMGQFIKRNTYFLKTWLSKE